MAAAVVARAQAEPHPAVPAWSSRPGATQTIYLDFADFNYGSGRWGSPPPIADYHPGYVSGFFGTTGSSTFTAPQVADLKKVWAQVAESYSVFANINVTTLDPAISAGQSATDAQRQAYYDTVSKPAPCTR